MKRSVKIAVAAAVVLGLAGIIAFFSSQRQSSNNIAIPLLIEDRGGNAVRASWDIKENKIAGSEEKLFNFADAGSELLFWDGDKKLIFDKEVPEDLKEGLSSGSCRNGENAVFYYEDSRLEQTERLCFELRLDKGDFIIDLDKDEKRTGGRDISLDKYSASSYIVKDGSAYILFNGDYSFENGSISLAMAKADFKTGISRRSTMPTIPCLTG